jgi:hypothetical protein
MKMKNAILIGALLISPLSAAGKDMLSIPQIQSLSKSYVNECETQHGETDGVIFRHSVSCQQQLTKLLNTGQCPDGYAGWAMDYNFNECAKQFATGNQQPWAENTVPFPVPRPVCNMSVDHRFCLKTIGMYKAALKAWPKISQNHAEFCADDQKGGPVHYPDLEQCVLDPLVEEQHR